MRTTIDKLNVALFVLMMLSLAWAASTLVTKPPPSRYLEADPIPSGIYEGRIESPPSYR